MKNLLLMAVTLFMLAVSLTSRAGSENTSGSVSGTTTDTETGTTNGFIGLWEAIDIEDGSHVILSITDNGDSTVKLLLYDTYFGRCNGGRGLGQGIGNVSAEQSLKVDDFTVTCFESSQSVKTPVTYTLNSDGTLMETVLTEPSASKLIYHQTSK